MRNIVVVGDSPLATLITRVLDRRLARLAHVELIHISRDDAIVYLPIINSLLGEIKLPTKSGQYLEAKLVKATIKQINLNDRRIITTNGTYDYDLLILDQTPTFISTEIKSIAATVSRIFSQIQGRINSGQQIKARLTFAGPDVSSWQLAIATAADSSKLKPAFRRSLSIQAQYPSWDWLKAFLQSNSVDSRKTVGLLPGATVAGAKSPFANRLVRGALLDDGDNFILEPTLNPERYPEVIIIDGAKRLAQNNLRTDQTLANKIVQNIERYLEGKRQVAIELPRPSGILVAESAVAAWVGKLQSHRLRARLLARLDKTFYKQLLK